MSRKTQRAKQVRLAQKASYERNRAAGTTRAAVRAETARQRELVVQYERARRAQEEASRQRLHDCFPLILSPVEGGSISLWDPPPENDPWDIPKEAGWVRAPAASDDTEPQQGMMGRGASEGHRAVGPLSWLLAIRGAWAGEAWRASLRPKVVSMQGHDDAQAPATATPEPIDEAAAHKCSLD